MLCLKRLSSVYIPAIHWFNLSSVSCPYPSRLSRIMEVGVPIDFATSAADQMKLQTSNATGTNTDTQGPGVPREHSLFANSFANGDLRLLSSDNVLFPMCSSTLSRASGWFRAMFTLPQVPDGVAAAGNSLDIEPLPMSEPAEVLSGLFSIIGGLALPALDDIDLVESILYAADKYEMSMPIAVLRAAALPPFLQKRPIRVYAIACRMLWEADAKEAASRTLGLDIMAPESTTDLARLETPYLMKLLALHDERRKQVDQALDGFTINAALQMMPFHNHGPPAFFLGAQQGPAARSTCESCSEGSPLQRQPWWSFKLAWSREPWRFVKLGEPDAQPGMAPELDRLFNKKCLRCGKAQMDEGAFNRLKNIFSQLPQTIEVGCQFARCTMSHLSIERHCYSGLEPSRSPHRVRHVRVLDTRPCISIIRLYCERSRIRSIESANECIQSQCEARLLRLSQCSTHHLLQRAHPPSVFEAGTGGREDYAT